MENEDKSAQNYIALLRGINVGGHRKIAMAELRSLLSEAGFAKVKTYIQTGNVGFQAKAQDKLVLKARLEKLIREGFGLDVPVVVLTQQELKAIFDQNPYKAEDQKQNYFVLLSAVPREEDVLEASKKIYPHDVYSIHGPCIYLYCPQGYGQTKFNLSYFEKKLHVNATGRNYNTIVKLLSLSDI
ncbi:MAG: DUF1697 domain-containing protein [Winogradskyella arenosi]